MKKTLHWGCRLAIWASFDHTLDSLLDDTLVINDTHGRNPSNNKRHPCNKRHSGQGSEKKLKDTQTYKTTLMA